MLFTKIDLIQRIIFTEIDLTLHFKINQSSKYPSEKVITPLFYPELIATIETKVEDAYKYR